MNVLWIFPCKWTNKTAENLKLYNIICILHIQNGLKMQYVKIIWELKWIIITFLVRNVHFMFLIFIQWMYMISGFLSQFLGREEVIVQLCIFKSSQLQWQWKSPQSLHRTWVMTTTNICCNTLNVLMHLNVFPQHDSLLNVLIGVTKHVLTDIKWLNDELWVHYFSVLGTLEYNTASSEATCCFNDLFFYFL